MDAHGTPPPNALTAWARTQLPGPAACRQAEQLGTQLARFLVTTSVQAQTRVLRREILRRRLEAALRELWELSVPNR